MPRMRMLTLVLAAVVVASTAVDGQTEKERESIQELIRRLESSKFVERAKAAEELEALGPAVLPLLRRGLKSAATDLESLRRIQSIVGKIEDRELTRKLQAASQIRVNIKDARVADAVAALARASDAAIQLSSDTDAKTELITLDTGKTSYWDAFGRTCRAAGLVEDHSIMGPHDVKEELRPLSLRVLGAAKGVHLKLGKSTAVPTTLAGSIRIRLIKTEKSSNDAVDLTFEIAGEPRLSGLEPADGLRVVRATDDLGQSLKQQPSPERVFGNNDAVITKLLGHRGGGQVMMLLDGAVLKWDGFGTAPPVAQGPFWTTVRLQPGVRKARLIQELTGKLLLQTNVDGAPIVIDNVLTAARKSGSAADRTSLTVQRVEHVKNTDVHMDVLWEKVVPGIERGMRASLDGGKRKGKGKLVFDNAGITITREDGPKPGPLEGAPRLHDADGNEWKLEEWNCHGWTMSMGKMDQRAKLVYRVRAGAGAPARLVWAPQRAFTFEVPFTLRDIQLP